MVNLMTIVDDNQANRRNYSKTSQQPATPLVYTKSCISTPHTNESSAKRVWKAEKQQAPPSKNWADGSLDSTIQLSAKVKAIVLARAAELREEKAEGPELSGGQDDD